MTSGASTRCTTTPHCVCDALELISHSLCTLEFADHLPLYDWVLDNINSNYHPPQIEFSRLGLEYTVMSKRFLAQLVETGVVSGWDDPANAHARGNAPAGYSCRKRSETFAIALA